MVIQCHRKHFQTLLIRTLYVTKFIVKRVIQIQLDTMIVHTIRLMADKDMMLKTLEFQLHQCQLL